MLSPGVPSTVAHDIAQHLDDPNAMAKSVVGDVMHTRYDSPIGGIGPAAAFDVLDLDAAKLRAADTAIKTFNDDAAREARASNTTRATLRDDVASVRGMVRFSEATPDMPWNADRPAMAVYNAIAADTSLDVTLRTDALAASHAVNALVLAHKESPHFAPFDGSSYRDAAGPTIHAPVTHKQIDPWAPKVSETDNAFYRDTDAAKVAGALA